MKSQDRKPGAPDTGSDRAARHEADRAQQALENVTQGYEKAPPGAADDPPEQGYSDRVNDERGRTPPEPPRR